MSYNHETYPQIKSLNLCISGKVTISQRAVGCKVATIKDGGRFYLVHLVYIVGSSAVRRVLFLTTNVLWAMTFPTTFLTVMDAFVPQRSFPL